MNQLLMFVMMCYPFCLSRPILLVKAHFISVVQPFFLIRLVCHHPAYRLKEDVDFLKRIYKHKNEPEKEGIRTPDPLSKVIYDLKFV